MYDSRELTAAITYNPTEPIEENYINCFLTQFNTFLSTNRIAIGYSYLWQSRNEIIQQQLILDSVQDSAIKMLHNKLIQGNSGVHHAHSHGALPTPFLLIEKLIISKSSTNKNNLGNADSHSHSHIVNSHGHSHETNSHGHSHETNSRGHSHKSERHGFAHEFYEEFKYHCLIKLYATLAFPILHVLKGMELNDVLQSLLKIITVPLVFFGINPLEGIYALNELSILVLGKDNILNSNPLVDYFKNEYVESRTENQDLGHFKDDYRDYMEFIDSMIHATDNFDVYLRNDITHSHSVQLKAAVHIAFLSVIYLNTHKTQTEIDHSIYDSQAQEIVPLENAIELVDETVQTQS